MAGSKTHVKLYRAAWALVLACVAADIYNAVRAHRPVKTWAVVILIRHGWDELWAMCAGLVNEVVHGSTQTRTLVVTTAVVVFSIPLVWHYIMKGKKPSLGGGVGIPAAGGRRRGTRP